MMPWPAVSALSAVVCAIALLWNYVITLRLQSIVSDMRAEIADMRAELAELRRLDREDTLSRNADLGEQLRVVQKDLERIDRYGCQRWNGAHPSPGAGD